MRHEPVLVEEVLGYLAPSPDGRYIDATVGGGGHARAILERSAPLGRLLGIDRDPDALADTGRHIGEFGDRVRLRKGSFADVRDIAESEGMTPVEGVIADLGLSSLQLDSAERGFSFSAEGPLDMRFDRSEGETAEQLVNRLSESELARILADFGEERRARAIARRIVRRRPIETTLALRRVVVSVLGPERRGGIDPATRTFQALRIAVNHELEALERFLASAPDILAPGGRLVVIAYHSLEDRAVKHAFRARSRTEDAPGFRVLTRKPVTPGDPERRRNPRSRSAKLRSLERVR